LKLEKNAISIYKLLQDGDGEEPISTAWVYEVMELQTVGKSLQITSDNFKKKSKCKKCTEPKGR